MIVTHVVTGVEEQLCISYRFQFFLCSLAFQYFFIIEIMISVLNKPLFLKLS